MPLGGGKYEPEARQVIESSKAQAVLVIVLAGDRGTGFSIVSTDPRIMAGVPPVLRNVADQIDKDLSDLLRNGL